MILVDIIIRISESFIPFYIIEFYNLIQDMSHLFFTMALSVQLFIYKHFDKKFQTGFEKLLQSKPNSKKESK